jgi:hypothetical protein
MAQAITAPKPTGGQQQYRVAICVLLLYPLLILGAALAIIPLFPRFHQSHREEVVSPTSHEPFHLSLSVLAPLQSPANRSYYSEH